MKLFLFFLDILCWPVEMLIRLLWRVLRALFASPWGLLIPLTLVAMFFLLQGLARNTPDLAIHYAKQWASCENEEIPEMTRALLQMEDAGLTGLVQGLGSSREAVFLACHETLQRELARWTAMQNSEAKFRHYRAFSEALAHHTENLSPAGREAAAWYAHQILRQLFIEKNTAQGATNDDFLQANQQCENLLLALDAVPRSGGFSPVRSTPPQRDMLARYSPRAFDPVLAYSGESRSVELDELTDPFATPRAERLYAYHNSPQYLENAKIPYKRPDALLFSDEKAAQPEELIATLNNAPSIAEAEIKTKIASNAASNAIPSADFAREYLAQYPKQNSETKKRSVFISQELAQTPLEIYGRLPTSHLMRLLHHADNLYANEARRTLTTRDSFQESHLQLAYRLYHPQAAMREELVDMLTETPGVRNAAWLAELLDDPDKNVRYRTAAQMATSKDVKLRQQLIEKGRRDSDPRIVELANKLTMDH